MDLSLDINPASGTYRDLQVVAGDLILTSDVNPAGTSYILQSVMQRLRMFRGEWFLNKSLGIPYYQQVLVKNPNKALVDQIFQAAILAVPGILSMLSYASTFGTSTRILTVTFRCQSVAGIISYSGPLNSPNDMVVI